MAADVMTADSHNIRPRGAKAGEDPAERPNADPVVPARPARPGSGHPARGHLAVVTESTHPEAFGAGRPAGDAGAEQAGEVQDGEVQDGEGSVADARAEDGSPWDAAAGDPTRAVRPLRRRGPLVTRWIGFSAQRRRAQERTNRRRHDIGAPWSGA